MVICLERGADLHMFQLMPLPLIVSCFSKIQIGFAFLVPARLGCPGKMAVKWVCVYSITRQAYLIFLQKNLFANFKKTLKQWKNIIFKISQPPSCLIGKQHSVENKQISSLH